MFRLAKLNRNLRPGEKLPPNIRDMSIFPPTLGRFRLSHTNFNENAFMDSRNAVYYDAAGEMALVMLEGTELEWGVYIQGRRLNDNDRSLNRDDLKAVLNAAQQLMK